MGKLLLANLLLVELFVAFTGGANAAPVLTAVQAVGQAHPGFTQVDYYWHHRRWHHRRWYRGRWHYWN